MLINVCITLVNDIIYGIQNDGELKQARLEGDSTLLGKLVVVCQNTCSVARSSRCYAAAIIRQLLFAFGTYMLRNRLLGRNRCKREQKHHTKKRQLGH